MLSLLDNRNGKNDFPISELENLSNPKEMQKMQLHIWHSILSHV